MAVHGDRARATRAGEGAGAGARAGEAAGPAPAASRARSRRSTILAKTKPHRSVLVAACFMCREYRLELGVKFQDPIPKHPNPWY